MEKMPSVKSFSVRVYQRSNALVTFRVWSTLAALVISKSLPFLHIVWGHSGFRECAEKHHNSSIPYLGPQLQILQPQLQQFLSLKQYLYLLE
jgi:hypothetical protein